MKIDREFKSLIPPLTSDEYTQLEKNILAEGIRDKICIWQDIIIDGHNRFEISQEHGIEFETVEMEFDSREDAKIWIIKNQFGRRNLSNYDRSKLALELEPLISAKAKENQIAAGENFGKGCQISDKAIDPIDTKRELATIAGVSHDTIAKVKTIEQKATPEIKEKCSSGEMSINQAYQEIKKEQRKDEIKKERSLIAEKSASLLPDERVNIYHGDIVSIELNKQYDFIITDPPYPKEFLHLYDALGIRSCEWLKDGGLLIAMCGQSYLDEIYSMLSEHLDYYWTACYLTPGQPTPLRQVNVNTTWKPLLIFKKKNDKYSGKIFGDVFKSDGNDKDFHKWGQSVSGMSDIITKVCLPGQSVLDPFCGAGTTGISAIKHGCFFDGIDIDIENVNITKGRIHDTM